MFRGKQNKTKQSNKNPMKTIIASRDNGDKMGAKGRRKKKPVLVYFGLIVGKTLQSYNCLR